MDGDIHNPIICLRDRLNLMQLVEITHSKVKAMKMHLNKMPYTQPLTKPIVHLIALPP